MSNKPAYKEELDLKVPPAQTNENCEIERSRNQISSAMEIIHSLNSIFGVWI